MPTKLDSKAKKEMGRMNLPDEQLDALADYFMSRTDLHGKVTLSQFLHDPERYKKTTDEESLENCF